MLPAARLSADAQGRSGWRISYRCVLLSICVHHSPKTTQKTSENWKRSCYKNLYKLAGKQLCDRGGRPMLSASPFFTFVVTGNRACETRLYARWAKVELLARQAMDAMRRLKFIILKLRLTHIYIKASASPFYFLWCNQQEQYLPSSSSSLFRQDSCPSSLLLCLIVFLFCQCFVFVCYLLPNV